MSDIAAYPSQVSDDQGPTAGAPDERIARVLDGILSQRGWRFTLVGHEVPGAVAVGPHQLLPVVLWRASKLFSQAFRGEALGVQFAPQGGTPLGVIAVVPPSLMSSKLMFSIEALQQVVEAAAEPDGPVPLDALVKEFFDDHDHGLVPWLEGTAAAPDLSELGVAATMDA